MEVRFCALRPVLCAFSSVFVPPLRSCCYFIHNFCPLSCSFFCWTLSHVACALWTHEDRSRSASAPMLGTVLTTGHCRVAVVLRSQQRKLLNTSYVPFLNSSIQLTSFFITVAAALQQPHPCHYPLYVQHTTSLLRMLICLRACMYLFTLSNPSPKQNLCRDPVYQLKWFIWILKASHIIAKTKQLMNVLFYLIQQDYFIQFLVRYQQCLMHAQ